MLKKSILIFICLSMFLTINGCNFSKRPDKDSQQTSLPAKTDESRIEVASKKYKILHIMSYHTPWEWTDTQLAGFKEALADLDVEYKVFQMDAKNNSSDPWKEKAGKEARELIDTWKPDLVYTSDDEAQKYVTQYYINTSTPFVFSAVNKTPDEYGFTNSSNVTGVLEIEHFVESTELFKKIVPNAKKIAVIFDDSPIWDQVRERMKLKAAKLSDMQFIFLDTVYTYSQYQQVVKNNESTVDGLCLVGIFNFKDENGNNVPYREVLQWTAENSKIPDYSFWIDRISYGTLCAVSVSGYEQGLAAGKIARGILFEGRSPASFPIVATTKGQPAVNLKRAKALGLKIDSKTLLSSYVANKYLWEK